MQVEKDKVVSIHYTLTLTNGELVDTTDGDAPLEFLAGAGQIIPGLEKALEGCAVGDKKELSVEPEEAYGEVDESLIQVLPREMFTGIDKIDVGMEFQTQNENGDAQFVIVTDVNDDEITIDGNHEFAGMVLNFKVSVEAIRDASEEELVASKA